MFNSRVKNNKLQLQVDHLKAEVKEYREDIEVLCEDSKSQGRQQTRALKKKNEEIEELREEITVYKDLENTRNNLISETIELEAQKKLLEAKEKQYSTFEKELKSAKADAKADAESKYQTGYSDGLADGLRKIHEITAEDRKQAMQVAALAASSHTPKAASKIAQGIQDSMMLEAGEDSDD